MAEESERTEDLRWLLTPPAPGEIRLRIAPGEGTVHMAIGDGPLTPEITAALEQLLQALDAQDVHGHAMGWCWLGQQGCQLQTCNRLHDVCNNYLPTTCPGNKSDYPRP